MYSLGAILLLILPAIGAYPSPTTGCNVSLFTAQGNEIRGEYVTEGWIISFRTLLKDGMIHAVTTFKNTTASRVEEGEEEQQEEEFISQLTFQDPGGRMVAGIEKQIMEAALDIVEGTGCNIPDNVIELYEEMADNLFQCTMELGSMQIRYSLMYFVSVVGSAHRLCREEESICTASPKYLYGESVFICLEDLQYLFDHSTIDDTDEKKPVQKRYNPIIYGAPCPFIHGSTTCCCGNYNFACLYCHVGCCIHDLLCWCCRPSWFCFSGCVPESGC